MAEITAPIVTITLVLAAVFVPVAFMPGMTGRLYNQFAMTIVFSFIFSAFNSLTFSPAMARLFLRGQARRDLGSSCSAGSTGAWRWLENSYDALLDCTAHHWWTIVVAVHGLLALTGWMIVKRPKAFIPTEDQGYLIVSVQTPDGTSKEATAKSPRRRASRQDRGGSQVASVALEGLNVDHLDQPDQLGGVVRRAWKTGQEHDARAASRGAGPSCSSRSPQRSAAPSCWSSSRRRSAA